MRKWINYLDRPALTPWLLALYALASVAAVFLFRHEVSGDQATYVGLAEGMAHGTFSYWWNIFSPAPVDTYRTQGYPAFLLLVRLLSTNVVWVKLIQLLLQFGAVLMTVRFLRRSQHGVAAANAFLLLVAPQLQLLYYTQLILPETLMVLLITGAAIIAMRGMNRSGGWLKLGVLLAVGFWIRPVLLFLPVFILMLDAVVVPKPERLNMLKRNTMMGICFALLGPLPFGYWNYSAHGHFSPVPLTGSSVVSNLGIWQLKLPGYGSMHYFAYSFFGREALPWTGPDQAARNYAEFQHQWQRIDSVADPARDSVDLALIPLMEKDHTDLFVTRSAGYAVALDKAIGKENLGMVRAEPGYYLASRFYTAARLWITNVNMPMEHIVFYPHGEDRPIVGRPAGLAGWFQAWYPFLISFFTFGLGLPFIAWTVYQRWDRWYARRWLLYPVLYIWLVHIPISIQSRYTIPVQVLVLACLALCLVEWKSGKGTGAVITK